MPVFDRLGNIVRSLHDALRELGAEQVLAEAGSEFPSARERLLHIARLTENAANTVLTKVEAVAPLQEQLVHEADQLRTKWNTDSSKAQIPEGLKPLMDQTIHFLTDASSDCDITRSALTDIFHR